jgi:hypothetical protein
MNYPSGGPLQRVLDRLWQIVESSSALAALVPPAGRLKLAGDAFPPPGDGAAEASPRLAVQPAGLARGEGDGDALTYVASFEFVLFSADPAVPPTNRLKGLLVAALERAGADLGLAGVERWELANAEEAPDAADLTRRLSPGRRADRRDAAGGRRVVMTLRVTLRPSRADLSAWLGTSSQPAGPRLRLFIDGESVGDEVVSLETRPDAVGGRPAWRPVLRVGLSAEDSTAFEATLARWAARRLRPARVVDLRDADTGRVRMVLLRVRFDGLRAEPPPAGSTPTGTAARTVEWTGLTFVPPLTKLGPVAVTAAATLPVETAAGVAASAAMPLVVGGSIAARAELPIVTG